MLTNKLFRGHSCGSATDCMLIAAGPLSKQPCTMPYRVVLIQYNDKQYSVHNEYFKDPEIIRRMNEGILAKEHVWGESHLENGNYFDSDSLVDAVSKFAERVARNAQYHQSLYRDEPELAVN